ncbi:hypothetical protein V2J09_008980 [Rumex salicifolius]
MGSSGLAGANAVIRDVESQQICWFTANVGVCTVVEAEHWGVIFGICMAWDMGLRKIHAETDFDEAKKLMEKEAKAPFNERGSSKSITPTVRTINWMTTLPKLGSIVLLGTSV